jgi:hypothetical protein
MKKTWSKKSRDTVPLRTYQLYGPVHNAFDAGKSISKASGRGGRGLGTGNRDFFGPCEMASSRQASAISQVKSTIRTGLYLWYTHRTSSYITSSYKTSSYIQNLHLPNVRLQNVQVTKRPGYQTSILQKVQITKRPGHKSPVFVNLKTCLKKPFSQNALRHPEWTA